MDIGEAIDRYEASIEKTSQCTALTRSGARCPNPAGASGYCFTHDPDRAAERLIAHKRGGFNRARSRVSGDESPQIKTSADLLGMAQLLLNDVWQMDNGAPFVKSALSVGEFMLRVFELIVLEARVRAIEEKAHGKAIEGTDQAESETI